ncbi:MAG TPA: metal ABC transporter substrate-binding protein [Gemmatimonadales bacterium]|nr:metal ABC transporter substrate-binding protein [Gemmatimonadales bacterium]
MTTLLLALTLASGVPTPPAPVKVVTSLTTYAAIAREVGGDRALVTAIAEGDEDPHFVQPRPSFVPLLRDADLFVTTGMDLELWVPTLLDRAGNPRIREGGPGYVAAFQGIHVLEIPTSLSRAGGDIHVDGNPHIHTDPMNGIIIARNILAGLKRVDPADSAYFTQREQDFEDRVLKATFGEELVRILTGPQLFELARNGRLLTFLQTRYQGHPLMDRLGGWMQQALPYRGKEMVCYHKEWAYFSDRFGVTCVEYLEPKPGIPPTPRHVQEVIALMRDRHIPVLFASNYFDHAQIRDIADRTNARAVIVPENTHGAPGVETYFDLVNAWVTGLAQAYAGATAR